MSLPTPDYGGPPIASGGLPLQPETPENLPPPPPPQIPYSPLISEEPENEALLTSMNLYEFSQVNNYEMGVLVVREDEPALYDDILQETRRIVRISEEIRVTVARVDTKPEAERVSGRKARRKGRSVRQKKPENGFCIRCREHLPVDPAKPYCKPCYRSWNRYKNDKYEEKHCHLCGNEHVATLIKPVCRKCYKKYKKVLTFPAGEARAAKD